MPRRLHRREFILRAGAGVGFWAVHRTGLASSQSPNEKISIGFIGVGGRGKGNLKETMQHPMAHCAALCDVDQNHLEEAAKNYPDAKLYNDFRKMLEEVKSLDAVVVATPDHIHAPAVAMAIKLGKHVYCEKPLAHSIHEARTLTELAAKHKVVTQMGNQGHSYGSRRRLVEFLHAGGIGNVTEVHAWTNRPIWVQGEDRPPAKKPPPFLHWDLWLGPAPERPYHDLLHPFAWRGWWDFGTGALGDMACHIMDAPFWGLKLGYPTHVEAEGEPLKPEMGPHWMTVQLKFPARGDQPPLTFRWYDGKKGKTPNLPPQDLAAPIKFYDKDKLSLANGNILVGDKGTVVVLNDQTTSWKVVRKGEVTKQEDLKIEQTLARTPEHHLEWLEGIRGGPAPLGNFAYSGPFTESVLVGIVAFRVQKALDWDGPAIRAVNCPEAAALIKREYRKGWTL